MFSKQSRRGYGYLFSIATVMGGFNIPARNKHPGPHEELALVQFAHI
jgi:hypothetical protein